MPAAWTARACAHLCLTRLPSVYPAGGFIWGGDANNRDGQNGEANGKCWCKSGRVGFGNPLPLDFYMYYNMADEPKYYPADETLYNVPACTLVTDFKYASYNFLVCPAGEYPSRTQSCYEHKEQCVKCPEGKFSPNYYEPGDFECKMCPLGYRSIDSRAYCEACSNGLYSNFFMSSACAVCSAGMYSEGTEGQTFCKVCPSGYFSFGGSSSCSVCGSGNVVDSGRTTCTACQSGRFEENNQCKGCPSGFYQNQNTQTSCKECPAGFSQSFTTQSECKECAIGFFQHQTKGTSCTECPRGWISSKASLGCTACQAGQFQERPDLCSQCPDGKISDPSSTSIEDCTFCQPGFFSGGGEHVSSAPQVTTPKKSVPLNARGLGVMGLKYK